VSVAWREEREGEGEKQNKAGHRGAAPRPGQLTLLFFFFFFLPPHTRSPIADAVALFHALAFAYHASVWGWHCTPAAGALPGTAGFGWFFRYLTFYAYTLQTLSFGVAAAAALHPASPPRRKAALRAAADDAACAVFGLTNVVTVMYYGLEAATAGVVEGGPAPRPPWLGRSVHVFNAAAAWADLLVSHPRSFSPRAASLSHASAGAYAAWLLVVRAGAGAFPYPILNALPMPWGYLGLTGTALALSAGLFALGRRLSTPLLRVKAKAGWPVAGV